MKKLIITLISLLSFTACTSNQNIEDPIYIKGSKTYSIIDNKAVSGTITANTGGSIKKKLYKDGVLRRVETRDIDGNIKTEVNYDYMGLKHGIKKVQGETLTYSHGVLQKRIYRGEESVFYDGVFNGNAKFGNKEIKMVNGTLHEASHPTFDKNIKRVWKITPENYTGLVYSDVILVETLNLRFSINSDRDSELKISEYKDGKLKKISLYKGNGTKVLEYKFYDGDIEKIASFKRYEDGIAMYSAKLTREGKEDGKVWNRVDKDMALIEYKEGIPHGRVSEIARDRIELVESTYVYRLGMVNGLYKGDYYIDGVYQDPSELEDGILESEMQVEDLVLYSSEEIKDRKGFSGYINNEVRHNKYSNSWEIILNEFIDGVLSTFYVYQDGHLVFTLILDQDIRIERFYENGILLNETTRNVKSL